MEGKELEATRNIENFMKAMKDVDGKCIAFRMDDSCFSSMLVEFTEKGEFKVIESMGADHLGFEALTEIVATRLWNEYRQKAGNASENRDEATNNELKKAAVGALKELQKNAKITVNYKVHGHEMNFIFTRAELEYICEEMFTEILTIFITMLNKHNIDRKDIKHMICCGGEKPHCLISIAEEEFPGSSLIIEE